MSLWSLMFPSKKAREQRLQEEAELAHLAHGRQETLQIVQSGSRLMNTYAGAMQMMVRDNEDR